MVYKKPERMDDVAIGILYGTDREVGLIGRISKLTFDPNATTAELEECRDHVVPALARVLNDWIASRHLCGMANRRRLVIEINSPAEDDAMDDLERLAARNVALRTLVDHLREVVA